VRKARNLPRVHDLVGDQNVLNPRQDQILRLPKLGAGDALCARLDLPPSQLRALVGLIVGPERNARAFDQPPHRADVLFQRVHVHDQRGRFQLFGLHVRSPFDPQFRRPESFGS